MAAKKIALFIDADNVSPRFGKQIFDALTNRGEIFIRRIYGNWEKNILHGWNDCILNFALRPVQQIDFVAGKNATDMSLTIDAMDILYGEQVEIFALVSNDSDFTPLAIRLREGGMTVVGLGNEHAANAFRLACSEFVDLDALAAVPAPVEKISAPVEVPTVVEPNKNSVSKKTSVQLSLFDDEKKVVEFKPQPSPPEKISSPTKISAPVKVQPVEKILPVPVAEKPKVVSISERQLQSDRDKKIQQIHDVLREVAKIHGDAQGFTPLCWAGQSLHEKNLGFGVKDLGYSFQSFIAAFPEIYELIYRTNGENYCYRLHTDEPKTSVDEQKQLISADKQNRLQTLHDVLREAAETYRDSDGFTLLNHAGAAIKIKNLGYSIKDFGYNQLHDFVAAFPELYETAHDTINQKFRYRCK